MTSWPALGQQEGSCDAESSREAKSQLDITLEALAHAATRFRKHTARPAVLVIDEASRLRSQDFWEDMLETATQWANEGIIRTVFVSSDDALIQSISSRCLLPGDCIMTAVHMSHACITYSRVVKQYGLEVISSGFVRS